LEWCRDNQFGSYQDAYILQPAVAVVALVRDPDDLQQLVREYGLWRRQTTPAGLSEILGGRMSSELLDWEMLAHDYDAVWFPNPYPHRLSGGMFFNILDVESTLWLRWNFYCGTIRKVSLQQEAVA
jgi:hypothetical protein